MCCISNTTLRFGKLAKLLHQEVSERRLDRYDDWAAHRDPHFAVQSGHDRPQHGTVKVTFLGTTTLLIDDGVTQLMIDGFLTRPSLREILDDRKVQTDPQRVDDALARAGVDERLEAVFVSHSHYDHALDAAHIVKRHPNAKLHGSPSTTMIGTGGGVDGPRNCTFKAGQKIPVGSFDVTVLASKHSPPTRFNNDEGKTITEPLRQPAPISSYLQGGTFDFHIRHGARSLLVKASANVEPGALDGVTADVLFLGTGRLAKQRRAFRQNYFAETVGRLRPQLVVPIHWDDLFAPLSENLPLPYRFVDNSPKAFNFLIDSIDRMNREPNATGTAFRIMQGYESVMLFRDHPPA